ncbi:MAG: leucine-rich repeat domain-containing protein [Lachnospiraceae bacterium]|nr:leucine-rich repeat domain-containing protein [Lachnospiraceae bacterium]
MKKKRMKKAIVSTIAVLLLVSSMDCMSVQAGSISESGSTQANVDVAEEQTETEIADCTADRTTDAEGFVWDGNIIVDYKGTATDIVIPARAAAIGYSAISGKGITSVRFEANSQIKEIGTTGFADNSLLSTVELPKGLVTIGGGAFRGCTALTSITIPDSVTSLGAQAFDGCASLSEITIPKSVSFIDSFCFRGDYSLRTFRCESPYTEYVGYDYIFTDCRAVTFYGYTGSTTENFAKRHNFPFVSIGHVEGWYTENGNLYCYDENGQKKTNQFISDGKYTYFLQADGTPMKDRLTYHSDGKNIIYLDENGHEVFNDFIHVKRNIEGKPVDDLCFFDVYGHMYVDCITYDQAGKNLYYANPYGVVERNGWFQFSDGNIGYANADGTLKTSQFSYDQFGRLVYFGGDGKLARGLISDGTMYYQMDETDGHCLGQFPM